MHNPEARDMTLQSVDRAVTLLQLLAANGPSRLRDLAAHLDIHKSSAARLVNTLERRGLISRTEDGVTLALGHGVAVLAAHAARPRTLTEVAKPVTLELAAMSGETASINVLSNDVLILTVDQVLGSRAVTGFDWVGQRSPAHATAAGKTLLAALTEEQLSAALRNTPLAACTEHTIVDLDLLEVELQAVRHQRLARSVDELEIGHTAIAAPIADASAVIASVSIGGPTARLNGHIRPDLEKLVGQAANEISTRLGALPRDAALPSSA